MGFLFGGLDCLQVTGTIFCGKFVRRKFWPRTFWGSVFFFPWFQWWAFPKKQDGNHEPECSHVILRWTGHDQYNCALVDIFCLCPMTVRIAAADQCQDGLDKASLLHEFGLFWIPKTAANALSICLQRFCLDSFQILWKEWNWGSHS